MLQALAGLLILFNHISGQGIGEVIIGQNNSPLAPELITVTQNSPSGTLPFFLRVFNGPIPTDVFGKVEIVCKTEFAEDGYTLLTFSPEKVTYDAVSNPISGSVQLSVSFSATQTGRANDVYCVANTVNNPSSDLQFNNTRSQTISIQSLQSPKLYFCSDSITMLNEANQWKSSFRLFFNDVLTSDLRINCSITNPTSAANVLGIPAVTITNRNLGQAEISYTINEKISVPFQVRCSGASIGSTQYRHSTSSTEATFDLDYGSATAVPTNYSVVYSTSYQANVYLDRTLGQALGMRCYVHTLPSIQLVKEFTPRDCQKSFYGPQPTTTTSSTTASTSTVTTTVSSSTSSGTTPANPTTFTSPITNPSSDRPTDVPSLFSTTMSATITSTVDLHNTDQEDTASSTTTTAAPAPTSTAKPVKGDLGYWQLSTENNTLLFETNTKSLGFEVLRTSTPTESTVEYIIVSCCADSPGTVLRYEGLSFQTITKFDYTYIKPVNSSLVIEGKTVIENPAYVDLAPCPCDLTADQCDIDCCCDSDCSETEKELFSQCIAGIFGGQDAPVAVHWCNQSLNYGASDWAPLLCTVYETNQDLGMFYSIPELISTDSVYPSHSEYNYGISKTQADLPSAVAYGYKKDYMIQLENLGYLSLPSSISNGQCIEKPLRYLNDFSGNCTGFLTANMCNQQSKLNAQNYLQRTINTDSFSPCYGNVRVLSQYGRSFYANVETTFHCTKDLSGYTAKAYGDQHQSADYLTSDKAREETPSAQLSYCQWDNDQQLPPAPTLVGDICRNALVDVSYEIVFSNQSIATIRAKYIMADIGLNTEDVASYTKRWYEEVQSSPFVVVDNSTVNTTTRELREDSFTITTTRPTQLTTKYSAKFTPAGAPANPVKYSGRPGYNFDTGLNMAYQSVSVFTAEPKPSLPSPGVSGLCEYSSDEMITFPNLQMTQCHLEISNHDFESCENLRNLVYGKMELLFPVLKQSMYLGRFGMPNLKDTSHWIPVLREVNDYTLLATTNVTTDNMTASSSVAGTAQPMEGAIVTTQAPATIVLSGCDKVPSSAALQVLYALTGQSGGTPIYQIVGAKVSIAESSWKQTCLKTECEPMDTTKQSLTFSTDFVEVPFMKLADKRWYDKKALQECQECEPPFTLDAFLFPIGHKVPEELRAENLALFSMLIACFILLWCISRPWWHKHSTFV